MNIVPGKTGGQVPRWLVFATPLFLAVVIITYVLIRIGYRDIPLERDEGAYLYMGRELLAGGVPYVDFFEMKPPGLYYSYALLYAISNGSLAWMHVWMALCVALGTLFLYRLALSWLGDGPALVTVVCYSALSMSLHASGFTLQAEHIVVTSALAGLYVLDRSLRVGKPWLLVAAGMLLCWSVAVKQSALFIMIFTMLYLVFAYPEKRAARSAGRDLALFVAGASVPCIVFLVVMYLQGSLEQFWFWVVEVSGTYVGKVAWADGYDLCQRTLEVLVREVKVAWVLCGVGFILLWVAVLSTWIRIAIAAFVIASALAVVPGLRFYGHYFLLLFPAISLCAGYCMTLLRNGMKRTGSMGYGFLIGPLVAAALFVTTVVQQRDSYISPDQTKVLRRVYGTNPFPEARMLADHLLHQENITQDDGLFVMGSEPQIYVYTGIKAPTRWIIPSFLMHTHPAVDSLRAELLNDLITRPPKYVVWVQHVSSWTPPRDADQSFLEEYWDQLHRDYEVIVWYEQNPPLVLHVKEGDEVRSHVPRNEFFMFLARHKGSSAVIKPRPNAQ